MKPNDAREEKTQVRHPRHGTRSHSPPTVNESLLSDRLILGRVSVKPERNDNTSEKTRANDRTKSYGSKRTHACQRMARGHPSITSAPVGGLLSNDGWKNNNAPLTKRPRRRPARKSPVLETLDTGCRPQPRSVSQTMTGNRRRHTPEIGRTDNKRFDSFTRCRSQEDNRGDRA